MKVAIVLSLFAAASTLAAQTPPQATFRGGVELVAVDFIAVAGDGRPVPDLKASELTLTVDGRLRDIRELQFVRLAETVTGESSTKPAPAVPVPLAFGSN